ncbi:V-set domain-containing T-cell activation inhibitor 1-like [Misgurnus anguillicaudatus]|uniref:V-set domain-containing T-cell activation inhibitor 1-like n=1 Tax=Misgurnus anguillicaudatus TaxID=75329 RepID=UPI003CCF1D05
MIYCIICVFALLINKVSLQDGNVVEGVTGGSVVLPCATNYIEHKLSEFTVQWRHNGSLNVCAIIKGKFSPQAQDFTYKNRTETFPTEYKKGNFSIKLNNLACTDAGNYLCYIIPSYEQVITQLIIKESTVHMGKQPTEENGNQGTIVLIVFCVLILCLVLCIPLILKKMRKNDDSKRHVNGNIEPHSPNPPSEQETETLQ